MHESRRDELIKAFMQTFCKYGLEDTTTKKLAEAANLSEAGLYVYFKNKEDILISCVTEHLKKVKEHTEILLAEFENKLDEFIFAMFEYVKSMILENRFMIQVLAHTYYSELIKVVRESFIANIRSQSFFLVQLGYPEEVGQAVVLIFNSALNSYILTKDEEAFRIQMNFIINVLKKQ